MGGESLPPCPPIGFAQNHWEMFGQGLFPHAFPTKYTHSSASTELIVASQRTEIYWFERQISKKNPDAFALTL